MNSRAYVNNCQPPSDVYDIEGNLKRLTFYCTLCASFYASRHSFVPPQSCRSRFVRHATGKMLHNFQMKRTIFFQHFARRHFFFKWRRIFIIAHIMSDDIHILLSPQQHTRDVHGNYETIVLKTGAENSPSFFFFSC